jgi:hypothetical protein
MDRTRNDNLDIYADVFKGAALPKIEIQSVAGGLSGVSATIRNTGEGAAASVDWTITITGGILNLINVNKADTITDLGPGEAVSISSGGFFGFGSISIVITADGASETKSGFHLVIFTIVN